MTQRFARIIEMLENVEHENQRETFCGAKVNIKGSDSDAVAVGTLQVNKSCVGFDACYLAELREAVEEESVSATYIQYLEPGAAWEMPMQDLQNRFFT
jgi:hypothetical protein